MTNARTWDFCMIPVRPCRLALWWMNLKISRTRCSKSKNRVRKGSLEAALFQIRRMRLKVNPNKFHPGIPNPNVIYGFLHTRMMMKRKMIIKDISKLSKAVSSRKVAWWMHLSMQMTTLRVKNNSPGHFQTRPDHNLGVANCPNQCFIIER